MKKITVIPQTINPLTLTRFDSTAKRRVAAYARVSTDSDEQMTSYEAQIDYYTHYIQANPEWEFVKVYSDEGITGTNTKNREGFKEMINDALNGEIDFIITKSISRFARNTVDTLVAIRKLKEKRVECYFEKENIYTFDSKGELLITIMSSIAQEESRNLSQNVTWGIRKNFSDGKVMVPYKNFLGYRKGENGRPEIVPEEADVVRRIYRMYLSGKSTAQIAEALMNDGIKSPAGKDKWLRQTVQSILKNEKYKGDALLQKQFTVDFLEKKTKVNEGEVQQYYVENSHAAIIDPVEWDMVQDEFERRANLGKQFSGSHVFASRIVCGDCGGFYGQKVWHSNTKYRSYRWQCNKRFTNRKDGDPCDTPYLTDETIKASFIKAFNKLNKNNVINHCLEIIAILDNLDELNTLISEQTIEVEVVAKMVKALIEENVTTALEQDNYRIKYNQLERRYQEVQDKLNKLVNEKERKITQKIAINNFLESYKELPEILTSWSDDIFILMVDTVIVDNNGTMKFLFKSGDRVRV
jgi:DNA invertase Pin-like site-specific DNA recombinase/regulator of replication initiation timing